MNQGIWLKPSPVKAIFSLNPDLKGKPSPMKAIKKIDLNENNVHWTFSAYSDVLLTPDFTLQHLKTTKKFG